MNSNTLFHFILLYTYIPIYIYILDEDHPTFSSCNLAFIFIETTCGKGNRVYFSSLSHTLSREGHSIHQIKFLTNALLTHPSVNSPDQVPLIMMIITWNSRGAMWTTSYIKSIGFHVILVPRIVGSTANERSLGFGL